VVIEKVWGVELGRCWWLRCGRIAAAKERKPERILGKMRL